MLEIPCFQVDAFTTRPFRGNPAAVCPLDAWLPDEVMLAIAAENALSETAFFVGRGDEIALRWFTPEVEVDLCGHATLATAFVITTVLQPGRRSIRFSSRSGPLTVSREEDALTLDFPSRPPSPSPPVEGLADALGVTPKEVVRARDVVAILERAEDVRALSPDFGKLARLDAYAVAVTAPGTGADADADFVSRFFAPGHGIPEDPVTGSAHCTLAPLWSARLGKTKLFARQVSRRQGELTCELRGDRVLLTGSAVLVKTGALLLPTEPERAGRGAA